jgi:hypothetical protein
MAKKKRKAPRKVSAKQRAQRNKFKAASKTCFATSSTGKAFGSCMRSEMKSKRRGR